MIKFGDLRKLINITIPIQKVKVSPQAYKRLQICYMENKQHNNPCYFIEKWQGQHGSCNRTKTFYTKYLNNLIILHDYVSISHLTLFVDLLSLVCHLFNPIQAGVNTGARIDLSQSDDEV